MDSKYQDILDSEILAFIKQTEDFYPADAVNATIEQQREYYDALCEAFDAEAPQGVSKVNGYFSSRDFAIPVRHYSNENREAIARILFFHGGGFVVGGLNSHDSICAELCARTSCDVTSVDYRLAPEYVHPASFEDCHVSYLRMKQETELPIILVGDSAGGNLAAAVSHALRDEDEKPAGQILIYPALGNDMTIKSYEEHADAPLLTKADCDFYAGIRAGGKSIDNDKTAYPYLDSDFSGLPPTVMISADCDPLRDDCKLYDERMKLFKNKSVWINEEGLIHGYLRARHSSIKAAESFDRIVSAAEMLAHGHWNFD